MSDLIIVIMQQNQYPFGQCDNSHITKKKIIVKKIIEINSQQKNKIITKAKKIKSLTNPYLIKLEQLLQQDQTLHLLYEYVTIKIEIWIQNLNSEFIENFYSKIIQLVHFFVMNHILIYFKIKNIGIDQSYNPKYFIGLNFQINKQVQSNELLNKYQKQIKMILNPYKNQLKIKETQKNQHQQPQLNNHKEQINNKLNNKLLNQRSVKQLLQQKKKLKAVQFKTQNEQLLKPDFKSQQYQKSKNIPVNLKIQNISRKIQDLKLIVNSYHKNGRPQSTKKILHKNFQQNILTRQSSGNVLKYDKNPQYRLNFFSKPRQTRQTQSQTQYEYFERKIYDEQQIDSQRQIIDNKKNYMQEFQNLFDDKQEPFISSVNLRKQQKKNQQNNNIITEYFIVQTQQIQSNKKQINTVKRRKRSGGSLLEQRLNTLSRMHEVLNTSKNLINKFKRSNFI